MILNILAYYLLSLAMGLGILIRKIVLVAMTIILPVAFIEVASIFIIMALFEYEQTIMSLGLLLGAPLWFCVGLWLLATTWCVPYFRVRYKAFYTNIKD